MTGEMSPLHVYTDGVHYWSQADISFSQWEQMVEDHEWRRYQTKNWAPLVSNLDIQIENPDEDRDIKRDKKQSILNSFSEQNVDS